MAENKVALLQRQSRRLTLVCSLTLLFGALLLRFTALNPDFSARRWMMISALVVAGEFWFLRRVLEQNHPPGQQDLYPDLGPANVLTIYRGLAYAWMAGFLLLPRPGGLMDWLPALLYIGASISDVFDGYLARRSGRVTRLGETLDMEFDGFGVLVACALAVQYGQLPLVFLLVAFARPLFVWGMQLRTRMELPNFPMTQSDQRRIVAGLLMIFLCTVLWPIFEPPVSYAVGAVFGASVSLSFLRDWLVNIGWLRQDRPAYKYWRARLKLWAFERAPVGLRIAIAALVSTMVPNLLAAGTAIPASLLAPVSTLAVAGGLTALLGIGARTSSGILCAAAYIYFAFGGQAWLALTLLVLSSLLLILGSGSFTLWVPEARWLRFGAAQE